MSSGRSNGQQSPYAVAITRKTGSGCWPGEIPVETRPSLRPGFWRPSPLPCTFCFLSDRSDATSGNAIPSRPLPGLHGPSRWTGLICSKRAAVLYRPRCKLEYLGCCALREHDGALHFEVRSV